MKRKGFKVLVLMLAMCFGVALSEEEAIKTPWDNLRLGEAIVVDAPAAQIVPDKIPIDSGEELTILGLMLVDLFVYETQDLGLSPEESIAVEIYQEMQNVPGIVCLTAENEDAVLVNGLMAKNTAKNSEYADMYWFEYNLETHVLRVRYDLVIESGADAEDFLSEYVFSSTIYNTTNGNVFTGSIPEEAIIGAFSGANIQSFFAGVYEDVYGKEPDF